MNARFWQSGRKCPQAWWISDRAHVIDRALGREAAGRFGGLFGRLAVLQPMFHRPASRLRPQPTATTSSNAPLSLSDEQLGDVMQICRQFPPELRGTYLERLAVRLRGIGEHGDGAVHRCATLLAKELHVATGRGPWAGDGGGDEDG
jgi:hypothetical protein